jgi:hypothetical protein
MRDGLPPAPFDTDHRSGPSGDPVDQLAELSVSGARRRADEPSLASRLFVYRVDDVMRSAAQELVHLRIHRAVADPPAEAWDISKVSGGTRLIKISLNEIIDTKP